MNLPKGWFVAKLGDVIAVIRGGTYKKENAKATSDPGYLPILRATNIDNGTLRLDELVYVPESNVSPEQRLRKGDIVIAASSGSLSVVGKAARLTHEWKGSFGAFCLGLRPSSEMNAAYIAHYLQT